MTVEALAISDRLRGHDWLMTQDWSNEDIELTLDTAEQLKKEFQGGVQTLHLPSKTIFLICSNFP